MDKAEYNSLKKAAATQLGADDFESLMFFASNLEKAAKSQKWMSIIIGLLSLPLMIILIGFPLLVIAIVMYFFLYKRTLRKASSFKEHLQTDSEFCSV
ncbi:MAG: hypothetical protein ACMZ64_12210 [Oleiphilus sp.]